MRHGYDCREQGVMFVGRNPYYVTAPVVVAVGLAPHLDKMKFNLLTLRELPAFEGRRASQEIIGRTQIIRR